MLNKGLPHPVLGNNNKVEFYRASLNCQKKTPIFFAKYKKKPHPAEVTNLPIPGIKIGGRLEFFPNLYIIGAALKICLNYWPI